MVTESFTIPVLQLPFQRSRHPIVIAQGFHGPYHQMIEGSMKLDYAVDFALPFGAIVLAVREGVVQQMSMDSECYSLSDSLAPDEIQRYMRSKANWILLDHGEFQTLYVHLEKGSETVSVGRIVPAGRILARTGRSGWVGSIPNLHFQAHHWVQCNGTDGRVGYTETVPIHLSGYEGSLEHQEIYPDV